MAKSNGRTVHTAVIAAAGSLSAAVKIGAESMLAVLPGDTGSGDFDANTVNLLFFGSVDDTNYKLIRDVDGTALYATVAEDNSNGFMYFDNLAATAAPTSVKIGTYQTDKTTAQTQTAETTIKFVTAKITS